MYVNPYELVQQTRNSEKFNLKEVVSHIDFAINLVKTTLLYCQVEGSHSWSHRMD